MGRRNIPEHFVHYFTFVQADGILKSIWNITTTIVLLLDFGLHADVFQNPQLLKYVYVGGKCNETELATKSMDDKFEIKSIDDFNSLLIIAESGNTKAMNEVAFHYENGILIDNFEILKADQQLAFNWTKKAYEKGDTDAIEKYADYLSDGEYKFCERNIELAMNLYEKAMKAGSNRATHCLGLEYRNKQNFEKAFELYEKSQLSEEFYQELTIGLCFYYGIGTKKDRLKALELFKKIHPEFNSQYEIDEANYLIGKIYLEGEVVQQSLELARQYLELADKDGDHRSAQELLIIIGRTKMMN